MITVLASQKDSPAAETAARILGAEVSYDGDNCNGLVVLLVSVDALTDGRIWDRVISARHARRLALILWRCCLVDVIDDSAIALDHSLAVVSIRDAVALPFYPHSGRFVLSEASTSDLHAAVGELAADKAPEWDSDTKWPESARAILALGPGRDA